MLASITFFVFKYFFKKIVVLKHLLFTPRNLLDLSFGRSIKIEELNYLNSSLDQPDKKMVFLSNNGDIVSIGKLEGNLFKPNKILL